MTSAELISLTIATVSGITFTLHKLGIIDFKPEKKSSVEPCPLHDKMTCLVDELKTTQRVNVQRHEQHEKELSAGRVDFHEIREEISTLRIGVGVLLDRTGGRPDDFRRKK